MTSLIKRRIDTPALSQLSFPLTLTSKSGKIMINRDLVIHTLAFLSFDDLGQLACTALRFRYVLMSNPNKENEIFSDPVRKILGEFRELEITEICGGYINGKGKETPGHIKAVRQRNPDKTQIFSVYRSLQILIFHGDDYNSLKIALQQCPMLKALKIYDVLHKDQKRFFQILPYSNKLQTLDIVFGTLTKKSIKGIGTHCKNLTELGIRQCGLKDNYFETLARDLPYLVRLDLQGNSLLTDAALLPFTSTREMIKLDVSSTHVTPKLVESLAKRARSLRSIKFHPLKNDISFKLASASWRELFNNCRLLEEAELFGVGLTDSALIALASRSPGLKKLNVSHNQKLTDDSFIFVAKNCTSLRSLQLDSCPKISEKAYETFHLLKELKYLCIVGWSSNTGMVSKALDYLRRVNVSLDIY